MVLIIHVYLFLYFLCMKQIISWIGKRLISAVVTAIFFILAIFGIVYATVNWPSTPPSGEIAGGKFSRLFNVCTGSNVLK